MAGSWLSGRGEPGRGPASISRTRPAVGGEVVGERGEFGGVAAEALHLVHGEDDPAVRGVRLDLPRRPQRLLEPGSDPHPGAGLLAEDLVPRDAVPRERVELGVEFLPEGRAPRASEADVRARQVWVDRRRRRGAGPPGPARAAVGGGRHSQRLLQPGHLREAAGVVGGGDGAAALAARRAGLGVTLRTGVLFDIVRVRPVGRGWLLRVRHEPGLSHKASLRRGSVPLLSENGFCVQVRWRSGGPFLILLPQRTVCESNRVCQSPKSAAQMTGVRCTEHRLRSWAAGLCRLPSRVGRLGR